MWRLMLHIDGLIDFKLGLAACLEGLLLVQIGKRVVVSYKFAFVLLQLIKFAHAQAVILVSYVLVRLIHIAQVSNGLPLV